MTNWPLSRRFSVLLSVCWSFVTVDYWVVDSDTVGGALATWNQPIEVVRVEMQSMSKNISKNRPEKLTVFNTLGFIYKENGLKGLYRGVTPRIGLGIWQTVCMVSFADYVKEWYGALSYSPHHDTHSFAGSRSQLRPKRRKL